MVRKDKDRARTFFLQRSYYYDTHDENHNVTRNISADEWKEEIKDTWMNAGCRWGAMIFHDRDVQKDGTLKELHAHSVVNYKDAKSFSSVKAKYGISRDDNVQKVKSIADSARYLVHISESAINEGKTVYSQSEVIIFGDEPIPFKDLIKRGKGKSVIREEIDESKKLTNEDKLLIDYEWSKLAAKVQNGEMSKKSVKSYLLDAFGEIKGQMAWIMKRSGFEEDFKEYMEKMHEYYSCNPRELDLFYVSGVGGIGKTQLSATMADMLADDLGVHKVAVPGRNTTFDFAGGYRGEKVTVANDLNNGAFHCRQWCNIFDPYEYSPINSRNFDKPWFARYCFVTNSDVVETFIKSMIFYSGAEYQQMTLSNKKKLLNNEESTKNMIVQVRRRIKYNLKIDVDPIGYKFVEVQKLKDDFSGFDTLEVIPFQNMTTEKVEIAEKILALLGLR